MHKQLIKAKLIQSLPAGVKPVSPKHKFLHASLLVGVWFYEDAAGLEYIAFFDSVVFVLSRAADKKGAENSRVHNPIVLHRSRKPFGFIRSGATKRMKRFRKLCVVLKL